MQDVDPAEWGGDAWRFLHTIAHAYPDAPDRMTRRAMQQLMGSLEVLLPCQQCRGHLGDHMRATGLTTPEAAPLQSRAALVAWMDAAHANANRHRDERRAAASGSAGAAGAAGAAGPAGSPARPPARRRSPSPLPSPPGSPLPRPTRHSVPPLVAVATGALVVQRPIASASDRFAALVGMEKLRKVDPKRQTAIVGGVSAVTVAIVALLVAFVVVTFRK
jgi:hypothetical protein